MPVGPALLAYQTEASLITAYVNYRDDGIHISWDGPIQVARENEERVEVARITQEIAKVFEKEIQNDPTSWHMQQRIFVDDGSFVQR